MDKFPDFMKNPANLISTKSQFSPGIEGYVFDGADGSQMAFWESDIDGVSSEHVHEYDEYFTVVQGCYFLIIAGEETQITPGNELDTSSIRHRASSVIKPSYAKPLPRKSL